MTPARLHFRAVVFAGERTYQLAGVPIVRRRATGDAKFLFGRRRRQGSVPVSSPIRASLAKSRGGFASLSIQHLDRSSRARSDARSGPADRSLRLVCPIMIDRSTPLALAPLPVTLTGAGPD
jgi:hypothetical protein